MFSLPVIRPLLSLALGHFVTLFTQFLKQHQGRQVLVPSESDFSTMLDLSTYNATNTPFFGVAGLSCTARLIDVHDGDTVTVIAEVFPAHVCKLHVRLLGIDAPEMTSKAPSVRELAERSRLRLVELLVPQTPSVTKSVSVPMHLPHAGHLTRNEMMIMLQADVHLVHLHCHEMDKYGRVLAEISCDASTPHAGLTLLREGLARPYEGGTKDPFEETARGENTMSKQFTTASCASLLSLFSG